MDTVTMASIGRQKILKKHKNYELIFKYYSVKIIFGRTVN